MPVGKETLGRIINVIGEPVDEQGPVSAPLPSLVLSVTFHPAGNSYSRDAQTASLHAMRAWGFLFSHLGRIARKMWG